MVALPDGFQLQGRDDALCRRRPASAVCGMKVHAGAGFFHGWSTTRYLAKRAVAQ